jgi:O-antigen/teichoic acid export membrane protein
LTEDLRTTDEPQDHTALAKGAGQAFFGQSAMQLLRFLTFFVIARYITPGQVGLFSLGMVTAQLLGVFGRFGADVAVIRFVAQYRAARDEARVKGAINFYLASCVAVGVVFGVFLALFAGPVAERIFHKPDLAPVLRVFAFAVPATVGVLLMQGVLRGLKDMVGVVLSWNVLWPGGSLAIGWIVLLLGGDEVGLSYAETVAVWAGFILAVVLVARRSPIFSRAVRAVAVPGLLLSVAAPLFVTDFVGSLAQLSDMFGLGIWATEAEVGVYRIAARAAMVGAMPLVSLNVILAPFVAEAHASGDRGRLASVYRAGSRWSVMTTLPVLAVFYAFAPGYLGWFGPEYTGGTVAFRMLLLGHAVTAFAVPAGFMLSMTGRQKAVMVISVCVAALSIVSVALLVPRFGMIGAGISIAAALVSRAVLQVSAVYGWSRLLPWDVGHLKSIVATAVAAAAAAAAARFAPSLGSGTLLVALTLVYFALYVALTRGLGLGPEDRIIWQAIRQKIRLGSAE